jgi:hypothetical protein
MLEIQTANAIRLSLRHANPEWKRNSTGNQGFIEVRGGAIGLAGQTGTAPSGHFGRK